MTPRLLPSPWLVLVLVVLATATQASAQTTTSSVEEASAALDLEAHVLPEPGAGPRVEPNAPSQAVPWNAKRANRGAFLLGFGTATAAISLVTASVWGRSGVCTETEADYGRSARYWGSTVAGLGGALAITGAGLLFSQPRAVRRAHRDPYARGLHTPGKAAIGVLLGLFVSGALVMVPSSVEWLSCID